MNGSAERASDTRVRHSLRTFFGSGGRKASPGFQNTPYAAENDARADAPTGTGKTFIACAIGQKACREGHAVLYRRMPRLFEEMEPAKGEGRHLKLLASFAKADLPILDDWGPAPPGNDQRRNLLKILADRHGSRSTLVTSKLPIDHWHEMIGDATPADAILFTGICTLGGLQDSW